MTLDVLDEPVLADVLDQTQLFINERREGIYSTDVAAILGLSRYGTPRRIYLAKIGEAPPQEPSLPAWIGSRLEALVAELYTTATGYRVRTDNLAHIHPTYPWLRTHLDRRVVGDPAHLVELKTRQSTRGWGEDGSAEVPPDVWCQVQVQLEVLGARQAHVATLFGNSAFRVYAVEPDPEFIAKLIPTLEAFWFEHVVAHVPPELTGHDEDTALVRRLYGGAEGDTPAKAATPSQEALVARYRLARANAAQAAYAEATLKNQVKELIGEASGIRGTFGAIWYRRTRDRVIVNTAALAQVYYDAIQHLLTNLSPEEAATPENVLLTEQIETARMLYTQVKPGYPQFRVEFREEDV